MKRSPLKRGDKPLERRTPLRQGTSQLKRSRLNPVSGKQRERKKELAAQAAVEAKAFKDAIKGLRCAACGKTEKEAFEATGLGHEAHHPIRKEVLKRLGLEHLLWTPAAAVCLCEEPCHRRHTRRYAVIPYYRLPNSVVEWALDMGLSTELLAEHPA